MSLAKNSLPSVFSSCFRTHRTLLVLNVQPPGIRRSCGRSCDFPIMRSLLFRCCSLLIFLAALAVAAKDVPADLLQYVKEAQKLGLTDQKIKDNAMKAGWPSSSIDEALSLSRSAAPAPAAGNAGAPAPPELSHASVPDTQSSGGGPDGYRIGSGDVLQINVWKDPDTSVPSAVVRPDGKIAMPLLKEVTVAGLTPKQAERLITDRLGQYIRGADVTVVVTQINSTKAYVVGAVKKEGPIPLQYRMSVLQAISEAGGLTDYAKRKKIYLLRTENGKQFRFPFNYDAVIKGQQMEQNIPVIPGDTIVVPH